MTQEEKYIEQHFGKENPFRVPEGYFANFAEGLMQQLPQQEVKTVVMRPSFIKRNRPYLYAAAFVGIALFTASIFFNNTTHKTNQTSTVNTEVAMSQPSVNDQADDYLALDNEDIYAYVAGY